MKSLKKWVSVMLAGVMLASMASAVTTVYAETEEMSAEFRALLTDGALVLRYVTPTSKDDFYAELVAQSYEDTLGACSLHDENGELAFSDDFSKVEIALWHDDTQWEERHTVDVVWEYDKKVNDLAQSLIKDFPKNASGETYFYLSDLEYINYLVNTAANPDEFLEMANYSGELKVATKHTNFSIKMNTLAGSNDPFCAVRLGITLLLYRDAVYYIWMSKLLAQANHIIYVPESTANTKEALLAAAQKRVDEYIGKGVVKIACSGQTVAQYYQAVIADCEAKIVALPPEIESLKALKAAEEAKDPALQDSNLLTQYFLQIMEKERELSRAVSEKEWTEKQYNNGNYIYEWMKEAAGDFLFDVTVKGSEDTYNFIVVKDDTKLTVPTYNSVDASTDASVSTDSSEVPLDTVIKVEKITHGEEHERICGALEIRDGEIYDIKLHSGSLDDYISKIQNGKFKVRLPIKEEYKGKELVVYYVDANGNKTKYNVTIQNNFAFFETDHFSIYTLVPLAGGEGDTVGGTTTTDALPLLPPGGTTNTETPADGSTTAAGGDTTATGVADSDVPAEDDGGSVVLWVVLAVVAVAAAAGVAFFVIRKKQAK